MMLFECVLNNREKEGRMDGRKKNLADVDLQLSPSHMQSK